MVKASEKPKAVKWDLDISDLRVYEVLFSQCGHSPRISMQVSGGDIRQTDLPMRHIAWYKNQLQSGPQWGSFIGYYLSNVTCFSRHWRNTTGETAQETAEHRGGNLWSQYWTRDPGTGPVIPVLDLWSWCWICDPGTGPVISVLDLWSRYWNCDPGAGLVILVLVLCSWCWTCIFVLNLWSWCWTCNPGTGPVILVLDLWSWYWPCYPNAGLENLALTLWSWRCWGRDKTLGSQSSLFCKFLFV